MLLHELYNQSETIILAHGYVGEILGKTVHGILMHSQLFKVLALVDRNKVGQDTSKICPGVTKKVPIYENICDAVKLKPKVMVLIGDPSENNLEEIKFCISEGLDIVNSSFVFLVDFPELVQLAQKQNVRLIDLRNVKRIWKMPDGSILNIKAKVVYVAGTDAGLGKRTATYELTQEAKKRGINAAFAATGQTGLMLGCDGGIVFDAIPGNYSAGAVVELILELDKKGYELIFLEGQASLMHHAYSHVITLIHAGNPHAIVLVHNPSRKYHAAFCESPIFKMCDLQREINTIESLYLDGGNKYKVVAVPSIGEENVQTVKQLTNLPVADVRKPGGPAIILDAVLGHLKLIYDWAPTCFSIASNN